MTDAAKEPTKNGNGKTGIWFGADGKTGRFIAKVLGSIAAAAVGGGTGYMAYDAMMDRVEATVTRTIQTTAPDKKVIEDLARDTAVIRTEMQGMRVDTSRDREEFRRNHVDVRGELSSVKSDLINLKELVSEMRATGTPRALVDRIEERLREMERRIAVLESKVK